MQGQYEREFTPRDRNQVESGRIQAVFDFWASRSQLEPETGRLGLTACVYNVRRTPFPPIDDGERYA